MFEIMQFIHAHFFAVSLVWFVLGALCAVFYLYCAYDTDHEITIKDSFLAILFFGCGLISVFMMIVAAISVMGWFDKPLIKRKV